MVNGVSTIPLPGHAFGGSTAPGIVPLRDFIAGPENATIAKVIRSYLDRSDTFASPLVVYGPAGSGKSHLARGVADWWRQHYPGDRALCFAGSEFAHAYSEAVSNDCLDALRRQLRDVALLVIDDVDQLAGKRGAQDELRATLDALADRDALVLVTAHELPAQQRGLTAGLRSRLSAGLNLSLALPGLTARKVLVKRLAAARGIALPLPALDQLAEAVRDSVPALLSAMLQLDLDARAGKQDFEPRRIRKLVAQRKSDRMPSLRSIATLTAKHYGLTVADLKSPVRRQALVTGRGVAMYLARQLTDKSLEEIGDFFGGRDHTTVMHSCRRTERLVAEDRETRLAVTELKRTLLAP